jgi:hypothetical protein
MVRPFFTSVVLALVLVVTLAVSSLSTAAAEGLPAVTVPTPSVSVPTPLVSTPGIQTPAISTPPLSPPSISTPSVKLPSVSTPSVHLPSVSAPGVGSTPSVSASQSGVSVNGVGASTGGNVGSSVGSQSGPSSGAAPSSPQTRAKTREASERARVAKIGELERHLKGLVTAHSACVATLSPQEQTVLQLRAGVGGTSYSPQQVARRLHLTAAREMQIEHAGLIQLQQAVTGNRCGARSVGVLEVPSNDRLVDVTPVLSGVSAGDSSGGSSPPSGSAARHVRRSSQSRETRRAASPEVQTARFAGTNTPLGDWALLIIGSIGALALLSTAGRRIALGQKRSTEASAGRRSSSSFEPATPAAPVVTKAAPVTAEVAAAGSGAMLPVAAAPARAHDEAQPEEGTPVASSADANPAAEPALRSDGLTPTTPASPQRPTVESSSDGPTTPSRAGKLGATRRWLHKHRSQIAIALTATAGVVGAVLRIVSRNRRRR